MKEVCCFNGLWIEEAQNKMTNTDYEKIEKRMFHAPTPLRLGCQLSPET